MIIVILALGRAGPGRVGSNLTRAQLRISML